MNHRTVSSSLAVLTLLLLPAGHVGAQTAGVDVLEETGLAITGYAERLSVQPGEEVGIMVSTREAEYRADVVRLIQGDEDPEGPGFIEEVIESEVSGEYPGRVQWWDAGSYVEIEGRPEVSGSFTVQGWVFPTRPEAGVQGIVTHWDGDRESGWGLFIDEAGELALWLADGSGRVERVSSGESFPSVSPFNGAYQTSKWFFVAGVYDAERGEVRLYQEPLREWPTGTQTARVSEGVSAIEVVAGDVPMMLSGYAVAGPDGRQFAGGNYSGKLEAPRVYDRALTEEEVGALRDGGRSSSEGLVAAWDFTKEIQSRRVVDASGQGFDGRTVNMPKRAVTGRKWNGREINFRNAPEQYGAIHFHDNALEKAEWEESIRFRVPEGLRSGFYAMRVRAGGEEDHIPFFVRPKRGESHAPIAYLVPTYTHLAYANIGNACPACRDLPTNGTYGRHSDGTGIVFSSAQRPILDMRPKAVTSWGAGGRTPRHYSADLYLIHWLEELGFEYDVITDGDLHAEGAELLEPYRAVITGSHPEYVSEEMLIGIDEYLGKGGRLIYLGGNGFYWITSVDEENPDLIEVRKWGGTQSSAMAPGEYYHSTTGELGGLWRNRGWHPQKMVGIGFTTMGWDRNAVYERTEASLEPAYGFIFEGVGPDEIIGDFESLGMGHGAAGDELDRADPRLGTPPGVPSLAIADDLTTRYQLVVEEILQMTGSRGGGEHSDVRSDIVYVPYPNQGAVFSAGSISWFASLWAHDTGYDNNVSRITENVLRTFSTADTLPVPGGTGDR